MELVEKKSRSIVPGHVRQVKKRIFGRYVHIGCTGGEEEEEEGESEQLHNMG
jgi:hypothetical protein